MCYKQFDGCSCRICQAQCVTKKGQYIRHESCDGWIASLSTVLPIPWQNRKPPYDRYKSQSKELTCYIMLHIFKYVCKCRTSYFSTLHASSVVFCFLAAGGIGSFMLSEECCYLQTCFRMQHDNNAQVLQLLCVHFRCFFLILFLKIRKIKGWASFHDIHLTCGYWIAFLWQNLTNNSDKNLQRWAE